MKIIVLICIILLSISCDANSEMKKRFGDGKHLFIEQTTGHPYIVEHRFGSNYGVSRLVTKKAVDGN